MTAVMAIREMGPRAPAGQAAQQAATVLDDALRMGQAPNPYDRVAGLYWAAHRLWLACAGGPAQAALLRYLADVIRTGDRLLEVGAGTGLLTRHIQSAQPAAIVSVLDLSTAMLTRAPSTVAERIVGSVLALPLADASYDVVVAGWVIETTGDPRRALAECSRVLRPGGHLLCCHASQPEGWQWRTTSLPAHHIMQRWFGGHPLAAKSYPLPPDMELVDQYETRRQLAAALIARKES